RTYHPDSLMDLRRTSGYWYTGGVEWRSTIAWAVAIVVGFLFSEAKVSEQEVWFTGLLADTWIGDNGLAWVATFVIAAGLYAALGGARAGRRDPSVASR